jgi:hypothetical protein
MQLQGADSNPYDQIDNVSGIIEDFYQAACAVLLIKRQLCPTPAAFRASRHYFSGYDPAIDRYMKAAL